MHIRELDTESERREAVPILRQLWEDKDPDEVLAWTGEEAYHLHGGFVDGELVAVAGAVVTDIVHHVRHVWLYDLVVDEPRRGEGYGSRMVDHVEDWGRERDCEYVALASPLEKDDAHGFYEGQAYDRWGYVIETDLRDGA